MRYLVCVIICLTLGLAPFSPEPHLFEKLRWIFTGAQPLRAIDWFDLLLHGTPWVVLFLMLARDIRRRARR